jgi:hypothetical protein
MKAPRRSRRSARTLVRVAPIDIGDLWPKGFLPPPGRPSHSTLSTGGMSLFSPEPIQPFEHKIMLHTKNVTKLFCLLKIRRNRGNRMPL